MEEPSFINAMRNMTVNRRISIEDVHRSYPNVTKLYLGRPEMLILTMANGRNMQLFRSGTVQILGGVSEREAQSMRVEFIMKLRRINTMQHSQVTEMTVSNLVMSVQLKKAICLQRIVSSDADFFHEIELFPAALIRKWHPIHIAVFHTGLVILTGLKSVKQFYNVMSMLISFFELSHIFKHK